MRRYTKIRAADNDKRYYVLRIDIVDDEHFVNVIGRGRNVVRQLRLILIRMLRKTLKAVISNEIDIVEEENWHRRAERNEPDDNEDQQGAFAR